MHDNISILKAKYVLDILDQLFLLLVFDRTVVLFRRHFSVQKMAFSAGVAGSVVFTLAETWQREAAV